jgi:hypothetical protein
VRRVVVLGLVLAGCNARPGMGTSLPDAAADMAISDGGRPPDLDRVPDGTVDGAESCPQLDHEVCGNGCDDDRNGYIDGFDPACTPQVLVTYENGSTELDRLLLVPSLPRLPFDGNPVDPGAHATYDGRFTPMRAFVALDGGTSRLLTLSLTIGASLPPVVLPLAYDTRDVCVFNHALIVVEDVGRLPNQGGALHRFKADGMTELDSRRFLPGQILSACTTDGTYLYVSRHDTGTGPSVFDFFDGNLQRVGTGQIPQALRDAGYDRCLDFAWTHFGFFGLFAKSGGVAGMGDIALRATQITPFSLDGGVAPAFDAGDVHGIGEFFP